MTARTIHIHEDDWGLRSLHPAAAWDAVLADVAAAAASGRRNRAADGMGWTALHVITPPAADFAATPLSLAATRAALAPLMPRVDRFNATASAAIGREERDPYGSYDDDAVCYGFDAGCFVKVEPAGERVRSIWYQAETSDAAQLAALRAALRAIDALVPAIAADYPLDAVGRIADAAFLDRYFAALAAAMA